MPRSPIRTAQEDSGSVLTLRPWGPGGLDLFTDPSLLPETFLARSENNRLGQGTIDRRDGALKLAAFSQSGGSRTFGADTKYATIPAAPQLLIPYGGFAVGVHFVATRPSSGNTGYILSSRPNGETFHVLSLTISDAGVVTVTWRDSLGNDRTIASAAQTADSVCHLLALYDAPAGTFTLYINGASTGTALTGLSSGLRPVQTAGVVWALGVEKETSAAVTANTHFDGAVDALTLFTLRGTRPASGTTTLAATLLAHSGRTWPNPQMDSVLAHYDCDETSGTTLYDRSRFKNHGTLVGGTTATGIIAMSSIPSNFVGTIEKPDGSKVNVLGSFGRAEYETVRGAA